MADAMVEQRQTIRFFCHRCNMEFEDVLQVYRCPYCSGGFIEQLEHDSEGVGVSSDFSDADMSNIDDISNMGDIDSDEVLITQGPPPVFNELAFLMTGGRIRGAGRRETLMEHLVWMIGGGRPGSGAVTAGAPFVLVGAPGDYVFGGEGLDAVVTQLLGQLENAGPPPLSRDQIAAIPSEPVTEAQVSANASCSVCWENFQIGEMVSKLECDHIFHEKCIAPWLQLHATCPICRRSLLPDDPNPAPVDPNSATNNPNPATNNPNPATNNSNPATNNSNSASVNSNPATVNPNRPLATMTGISAVRMPTATITTADSIPALLSHLLSRQDLRRRAVVAQFGAPSTTSSSSLSSGVPPSAPRSTSGSDTSLNSDREPPRYNMDIDYD